MSSNPGMARAQRKITAVRAIGTARRAQMDTRRTKVNMEQARYGAEKRTMLLRVSTNSAPSLAASMSTGLPGTAPNA